MVVRSRGHGTGYPLLQTFTHTATVATVVLVPEARHGGWWHRPLG